VTAFAVALGLTVLPPPCYGWPSNNFETRRRGGGQRAFAISFGLHDG